jgi:hypothetical protein
VIVRTWYGLSSTVVVCLVRLKLGLDPLSFASPYGLPVCDTSFKL